jgi:PhzF family phenazine biosynthesis protein
MLHLSIHQLAAFADAPFEGNPAAVCPLETWLDDAVMQAVALENNLSETAFLVPRGDDWDLRWFTPAVEVDLCGHATLASGAVVLDLLRPGARAVRFHTRSGALNVERSQALNGDGFALDLPARPPRPVHLDDDYLAALGARPVETLEAGYRLCVFEREADVRALAPDFRALARVEPGGVVCTAPGEGSTGKEGGVDFVSRFFAPAKGIDEDPVTGSAHCLLTPFWAARLERASLRARQVSARGGSLLCTLAGERVRLEGRVQRYLSGTIEVPERLPG